MKQSQIDTLTSIMYDKVPPVPAVQQMVADNVLCIVPFIDSLVDQARKDSRLEVYLEICEAQQRKLRVAAKFNREAMDTTATPF